MSNYCTHDSSWWEETDDNCQFCTQCSVAVCDACGAHYEENGVDSYAPHCDCDDPIDYFAQQVEEANV